mmetsp:Transcript_55428/g.159394  ORF Transcript_55428/g.159394 Transcript_55428/m.159394 type:complete len:235 (-) Transcript_55428:236-940(-)
MCGALRRLSSKLAKHPFAAAVVFSTVKGGSADAFTQRVLEGKSELDRDRLAVFITFGFFYQGGFQYMLWAKIFERIWPGRSFRASLSKLVATNLISDPVFFFPTFYVIREALTTKATDRRQVVPTALRKYRDNCFRDWVAGWCVWFPGHYVTYFWMPLHLRVPWVACASFSYICLLSYLRGDARQEEAVVVPKDVHDAKSKLEATHGSCMEEAASLSAEASEISLAGRSAGPLC